MELSMKMMNLQGKVKSMHPKKFALWLFLISVTMIFASLTSAYIVKKADGDWAIIDFPFLFNVTTGIIVLSSATMQWAYLAAKRNNLSQIRWGLAFTSILAVAFVAGQWMAWGQLYSENVVFEGNAAGSFVYVFTGLHVAHLIGGLIFLFLVLIAAFKYEVHSKSLDRIEMCATYWHFLGGLWVYLYLFLIFNN